MTNSDTCPLDVRQPTLREPQIRVRVLELGRRRKPARGDAEGGNKQHFALLHNREIQLLPAEPSVGDERSVETSLSCQPGRVPSTSMYPPSAAEARLLLSCTAVKYNCCRPSPVSVMSEASLSCQPGSVPSTSMKPPSAAEAWLLRPAMPTMRPTMRPTPDRAPADAAGNTSSHVVPQ